MSPSSLNNDLVDQLQRQLQEKLETLYIPPPHSSSNDSPSSTEKSTPETLRKAVSSNNNNNVENEELKQQALSLANMLEESLIKLENIKNNKKSSSSDEKNSFYIFDLAKILSSSSSSVPNQNASSSTSSSSKKKKGGSRKNANDDDDDSNNNNSSSELPLHQLEYLVTEYIPKAKESISTLQTTISERKAKMVALKAHLEQELRSDEEESKKLEVGKMFKNVEGLIAAKSYKEAASLYLMAENMISSIQNEELRSLIERFFETKLNECKSKIGDDLISSTRSRMGQQQRSNSDSVMNGNDGSDDDNNNNKENAESNKNKNGDDDNEDSDVDVDVDEMLDELD